MTNLIIASFEKEDQAIEASRKLSQFETLGDITIFERVIVRKNVDGSASVLQAAITDGHRSISGTALDTLVDALGGPVGMMIGIVSATLGRTAMEENYFGFPPDFESKFIKNIMPGEASIIAEIDEDDPAYVNEMLGGKIIRNHVDYEYTEYAESHVEVIEEEIAMKRIRMKSAGVAERALIIQKISDLKEKRRKILIELDKKTRAQELDSNSAASPGGNRSRRSLHELKISRLKNRIEKHQMILKELKDELKHMEE